MKIKQQQRELSIKYYDVSTDSNVKQQGYKFIFPCPGEKCKGFLTTAYKCEICKYFTCSKCLIITGTNKTDDTHVCDQELVKTAKLIKDTTKPCPKCGERIMKQSGCDQMWCTSCKTAFSWKTGIQDNGVVHNPHFFQYQRATNNAEAVRNPEDIVCGGIPRNWYRQYERCKKLLRINNSRFINNKMLDACKYKQTDYFLCGCYKLAEEEGSEDQVKYVSTAHLKLIDTLSSIFEAIQHINNYELPNFRRQIQETENRYEKLRVSYLLDNITKDKFAQEIIKRDKRHNKIVEITHIYELISAVGIDSINHLINFIDTEATTLTICDGLTKIVNDFDTFLNYVNNEFKIISVTYNQSVPQLLKSNNYAAFAQGGKTNKFKLTDIETSP